MNFGVMKTRVWLRVGNMQTSDPFYYYVDEAVNEAVNSVAIRTPWSGHRIPDTFLGLAEKWTDLTVLDTSRMAIPNNVLIIQDLYSFDDDAVPDLDDDDKVPMTEITMEQMELLPRSSTNVGFPRMWAQDGNWIYMHPTPRTGYLSYIMIRGTKIEVAMTSDSDTPAINLLFHEAIVDYACYLVCKEKGWYEDGEQNLQSCDRRLAENASIIGYQLSSQKNRLRIAGNPVSR